MNKQTRLIMIGNSHIDPVWLWLEEEGLQEVKATFASALERMREFPEFQFSASSAAFYDWVRKNHPGLFKRIKRRVDQGRWHLVGGWWVEPDVNIASGESLVRQGLYGQRFFRKHFGRMARVAFNVDSFGHSKGLPSILRGQGIEGYVFMRPHPWQNQLPGELFDWVDDGGLPVKACRISGEYCAWTKTAILSNIALARKAMADQQLGCFPAYYGVGNHGGGPTIENIKAIREIRASSHDMEIRNGSLEECLDAWHGLDLPRLNDELQGCFPGCFSADSQIKTLNRDAESALSAAETLAVLAMPHGFKYPAKRLRRAWKKLLFQQFHDTLAGTARKDARDEAVTLLHACISTALSTIRDAVQALSAAIDTRGDGLPLLLFNPNDSAYRGLVEADIPWRSKFPLRLKDPNGDEIAYDTTTHGLVAPDARKRLVFYGNVPAFGYSVYRLMPETPAKTSPPMICDIHQLENDHLSLHFKPEEGLVQVVSKQSGKRTLSGNMELVVYEDRRDTWGAQGDVGSKTGSYRLVQSRLVEHGAKRSTIHLSYAYENSQAELTVSLGSQDDAFSIAGSIMNQQRLAMTVLRLPLAFTPHSCLAEAPYAQLERAVRPSQEEVCQRFLEVRGENRAMLVLNRAKYSYRIHEGALEIILSRSPVHAFSSGEHLNENQVYEFSDQGELPFTLHIYPDSVSHTVEDRVRAAHALHRPVRVLFSDNHPGHLVARSGAFARAEGLTIHQFKRGEDGGIIARVQNLNPETANARVTLHGQTAACTLAAFQPASLVFPEEGQGFLADLLEEAPINLSETEE